MGPEGEGPSRSTPVSPAMIRVGGWSMSLLCYCFFLIIFVKTIKKIPLVSMVFIGIIPTNK